MTAAAAIQTVQRVKSPALRGFESNPFRILRLPVTASTSAAAMQAESALTLTRVGLAPEEPEPLPWLPRAGSYELQKAAQSVEEPLVRLKFQLLWFDFERDPQAPLLGEALADPCGSAMRAYLAAEKPLTAVPGERAAGSYLAEDDALIAQAINQANARLLAAAAMADGYFQGSATGSAPIAIPAEKWKTLNGFQTLPQAHMIFASRESGGLSPAGPEDWRGWLQRWTAILTDARFKSYLTSCIRDLDDDFVSADDIEAVEESVQAFLADLAAQQARFFVLEARYPLAMSVISAVANSGMELRVIAPAMRPLRQVFQSEIGELDPLLETAENNLEAIDAYLKRLDGIRARWQTLDGERVVGTRDILDQALEKAYLRLRSLENTDPAVDKLLGRIGDSLTAESMKSRVKGYEKELEERRTRLCHFCKTGNPDYDKSVVLRGKKETGRTRNYGSTTIYFNLRYGVVMRCTRCANFHQYIRNVGLALWFALAPGLIYLCVLMLGGFD
jgi:hypothetical protein